LVTVLFTFYIQSVLKLEKNNSGAKGLIPLTTRLWEPLIELRLSTLISYRDNESGRQPDLHSKNYFM
jgi:hypothetical protein